MVTLGKAKRLWDNKGNHPLNWKTLKIYGVYYATYKIFVYNEIYIWWYIYTKVRLSLPRMDLEDAPLRLFVRKRKLNLTINAAWASATQHTARFLYISVYIYKCFYRSTHIPYKSKSRVSVRDVGVIESPCKAILQQAPGRIMAGSSDSMRFVAMITCNRLCQELRTERNEQAQRV